MPSDRLPRIDLVEDDPIMGESLVQRLSLEGFEAHWWQTGAAALDAIRNDPPGLLVCDIRLPDMSGEDLFRKAQPKLGTVPVLFITAFGDIDQAVRLIRAGAADYIIKPFDMGSLLERLAQLLEQHSTVLPEQQASLGRSEPMRRIESVLRRVADIESSVLLMGESGVGKEVAARFLHRNSCRSDRPFIAVNCAAIPADLIDSEIFGHEKGSFTSAHARHLGYAERAGTGILFLDEISELQPSIQAKLLRLLQERVFFRVGGEQHVPFKARLLCATNADLAGRVSEGRFRQDLFYRINVIAIDVPPLRERRAEILPLIARSLAEFGEQFGGQVHGLTTLAEEAALVHDWPGNVRELRNRVERAVALADGPWIGSAELFPESCFRLPEDRSMAPLAEVRDAAERRHILAALKQTQQQIGRAAALLGVSRTTLWNKMRKFSLSGTD